MNTIVSFPQASDEPGLEQLVKTTNTLIACLKKCRASDDIQLSATMWVLASGVSYHAESEANVHSMMKEVHERCLDAALIQYRRKVGAVQ